jgi:N6-L-threonylcarbamoyladenine synthase
MKILSIETSCDETAISIIEVSGDSNSPVFSVLGDQVHSQIEAHAEYGGVFPNLAKREHAKNLPIILENVLKQAKCWQEKETYIDKNTFNTILSREPQMAENLFKKLSSIEIPNIDHIAVTTGPGLEPTLWIGIMFAQALSYAWNIPITPVNHMEGHLLSVLLDSATEENKTIDFSKLSFPIIGLLISGGHTELINIESIGSYKKIGQTLDDAAGEAFDKVARVLELPYPGGPKISKLAKHGQTNSLVTLPRPMLRSDDYNFSFSGLKTAVLYLSKKLQEQNLWNEQIKADIARDFENACAEVLLKKTQRAIQEYQAKNLIIAGGVSANTHIKEVFTKHIQIPILFPKKNLTGDNSIMIGITGYFQIQVGTTQYLHGTKNNPNEIRANGNWSVDEK